MRPIHSTLIIFVFFCLMIACEESSPEEGTVQGGEAGAHGGSHGGAGDAAGVSGAQEAGGGGEGGSSAISGTEAGTPEGGEVAGESFIEDMGTGDMLMPDMIIELDMMLPPECLDGLDNDEDNLIDYPRDPGCTSSEDLDERDPERFECEDEIDNDEDGAIDLDDPGCALPTDVSELSTCRGHEAIDVSAAPRTVSSSEGQPVSFEACRNNNAPERVFMFTLRQPVAYLYFSTEGSGFDTLLSVRRSCEDDSSEVACNDDAAGRRTSAVQLDRPSLGDYYIIVDGYSDERGVVVLNVEAGVEDGEPCPDEGSVVRCPRGSACSSDGLCAPAVCSDELDNDEDTLIDYPNDPGCETAEDLDETDPEILPECGDGEDNDRDTLIDFPLDPECLSASDQREGRDPGCADGLDNDQDGYIDLLDPGCDDEEDTSEYHTPFCQDRVDNDEDGLIDFPNDPGCLNREDPDERDPTPLPECADGLDNDGDELTDYPDDLGSCTSASDPIEDDPCSRRTFRDITGLTSTRGNSSAEPNDFVGSCGGALGVESLLVWRVEEDRPLDSLEVTSRNSDTFVTVYARDRCTSELDSGGSSELVCSTSSAFSDVNIGARAEGEDVYLFVDSNSTGGIWRLQLKGRLAEGARCDGALNWTCADDLTCLERIDGSFRCVAPQCSDGIDNDTDGLSDFPNDPGCETPADDSEVTPTPIPSCANNVDDDGDGLFDFGEDPDCDSASDDYELPACRDTLDNDGDGRTDFEGAGLSDQECSCANDPTEDQIDAICSDGCDNDGDGLVDLADPGCSDASDTNEYNSPECADGFDNDQNGQIDYPNDVGCLSRDDLTERDPDILPSCGDGVDNDEDALTDYPDDDGCFAASDDTEESICDLDVSLIPDSGVISGDTLSLESSQVGSCSFGNAPEAIWRVELPHPALLKATTEGSSFNTVLYMRSTCRATIPCIGDGCTPTSSELGCQRDPQGGSASELILSEAVDSVYIFVDGFGAQGGPYSLSVTGVYPIGGPCEINGPSFVQCAMESVCGVAPGDVSPTCHIEE